MDDQGTSSLKYASKLLGRLRVVNRFRYTPALRLFNFSFDCQAAHSQTSLTVFIRRGKFAFEITKTDSSFRGGCRGVLLFESR
jgi:hypothetical protein